MALQIMPGPRAHASANIKKSERQLVQTYKDAEALLEIHDEMHRLVKVNEELSERAHSAMKLNTELTKAVNETVKDGTHGTA